MRANRAEAPALPDTRATRATVDLDAIADNVRAFQTLASGSQIIAVVKANAYGHGAVPVAAAALEAGASQLAVYTLDEAAILRAAGIRAPVLLFGPLETDEVTRIRTLDVSPTVSDVAALRLLDGAGRGHPISVHVKVDTGLTRAGASPRDAVDLAGRIDRHPLLRLASVYTHFARADEQASAFSETQVERLMRTVAQIERMGIRVPLTHASNTAGTLNLPNARLGAVRVGIGLYGYNPSRWHEPPVPLRRALSLASRLIRVTRISKGTGVGYGHEFWAGPGCTVGLVPIGYGDGLPRHLGLGKGRVLVRGHLIPIVGRVSMDQITVDLTGIEQASLGDEAVLIGQSCGAQQTADDLADQAGTISYDIVTGLLPRVPRLYVRAGRVVGIAKMGTYVPVSSSS